MKGHRTLAKKARAAADTSDEMFETLPRPPLFSAMSPNIMKPKTPNGKIAKLVGRHDGPSSRSPQKRKVTDEESFHEDYLDPQVEPLVLSRPKSARRISTSASSSMTEDWPTKSEEACLPGVYGAFGQPPFLEELKDRFNPKVDELNDSLGFAAEAAGPDPKLELKMHTTGHPDGVEAAMPTEQTALCAADEVWEMQAAADEVWEMHALLVGIFCLTASVLLVAIGTAWLMLPVDASPLAAATEDAAQGGELFVLRTCATKVGVPSWVVLLQCFHNDAVRAVVALASTLDREMRRGARLARVQIQRLQRRAITAAH